MKREIKFRGKGLNTDQWFYGGVWYSHGAYGRSDESKIIITTINNNGEVDLVAVPVDPKTVGQYTGLTDGDGVDIYEGDIVTFDRSIGNWTGHRMKTEHEVYYECHISAFVMKAPGSYIKLRRLENRYIYKVIGNVYENKRIKN